MILVDPAIGSRELLQSIRNFGADAELAPIDADFLFTGNGPEGDLLCGFERKQIGELLQCMRSKRLAGHQVGKMTVTCDVSYLVIEGVWRRGRNTGLVEVMNGSWHTARGNFRYSELSRFLASLRELGGLYIWRTADEEETAAYVAEEYLWWQKEWAIHKTHQQIYAPEPKRLKRGTRAVMFRQEVTLLEKWLCALPGIDSRAIDLAKEFESAGDMANADVTRWVGIRGIGKKTAQEIVMRIGERKV